MSVYRADGAVGRGFSAFRLLPDRLRRSGLASAEPVLGRIGDLEVRVAASRTEVRAAQALRYQVFYSQGGAKPSALQRVTRLDKDAFDRICDHLIVLDKSLPGSTAQQIVGTYRLLRQERLPVGGRFYTEQEFEIGSLVRRHPHVFGDGDASTPEEVEASWEQIKAAEKADRAESATPLLEGIPRSLSTLLIADKVLARRERSGLTELPDDKTDADNSGADLGDRLLALVAEGRRTGVDADAALRDAVRRLASA